MLETILPTPVKPTYSEILLSTAATVAFQAIEKSGRPVVDLSRLSERPQYGYTASAQREAVGPRLVRITDLRAGSLDWRGVPYCECPEPEKYLLKSGDILVARSGSVGKSFLVSECPEPAVFASYMIRIRAKPGVLPGYIYWFLQTQQFWLQIRETKRGSAMKNINSAMITSAQIPEATPSQQGEVLSYLRWFQARLNGDCEALPPDVPQLFDTRRIVARTAELAALIQEAQELRAKAREDAGALFTAALSQLYGIADARGWQTRTLGELTTDVRYGLTAKASAEPVGPILLRITDIGDDGRLSYNSPKYVAVSDKEYERFKLSAGDIVIGRSGSVGKSHLFTRSEGVVFASYLIRFRPRCDMVMPEYLQLTLRSSAFSAFVDREKTVSAQPNVSASKLKKFVVPLPDLREQSRIVGHMARLQEEMDRLTDLQAATQTELDALLPSVLDRAFRGEL